MPQDNTSDSASKKADQILSEVNSIIESSSSFDKFELHQKLIEDWKSMSCDERKAVGRQLESKAANADASVSPKVSTSYYNGNMLDLSFRKDKGWEFSAYTFLNLNVETVSIPKPLENCKK